MTNNGMDVDTENYPLELDTSQYLYQVKAGSSKMSTQSTPESELIYSIASPVQGINILTYKSTASTSNIILNQGQRK